MRKKIGSMINKVRTSCASGIKSCTSGAKRVWNYCSTGLSSLLGWKGDAPASSEAPRESTIAVSSMAAGTGSRTADGPPSDGAASAATSTMTSAADDHGAPSTKEVSAAAARVAALENHLPAPRNRSVTWFYANVRVGVALVALAIATVTTPIGQVLGAPVHLLRGGQPVSHQVSEMQEMRHHKSAEWERFNDAVKKAADEESRADSPRGIQKWVLAVLGVLLAFLVLGAVSWALGFTAIGAAIGLKLAWVGTKLTAAWGIAKGAFASLKAISLEKLFLMKAWGAVAL